MAQTATKQAKVMAAALNKILRATESWRDVPQWKTSGSPEDNFIHDLRQIAKEGLKESEKIKQQHG
jgi:hypothetical protein